MKPPALQLALTTIGLAWGALSVRGQVATGRHLYTKPDPSAEGGIRGRVVRPARPMAAAFAIPSSSPALVYRARLTDGKRSFELANLPVERYDLLIVFDDVFYEGLALMRGHNSLSKQDGDAIRDIIRRSEPYYNEKAVHRLAGTTGRMTGRARCICTFLRTKTSVGFFDGVWHDEHRRSLKLAMLEQVGPGWQVARTREIFTVMVPPKTGNIRHAYRRSLRGIRVTDAIRDMGEMDLVTEEEEERAATAQ